MQGSTGQTGSPAVDSPADATSTAFQPAPTTPAPTITPRPVASVWISAGVAPALRDSLTLPGEALSAAAADQATLVFGSLQPDVPAAEVDQTSQWVYALVAPFETIADGVNQTEFLAAWRGDGAPAAFSGKPLLMDETTLAALTGCFGPPAQGAVEVHPAEELLDSAWNQRPAWAVIPFEEVQPRWKVLRIDGQTPLSNQFQMEDYLLTIPFGFRGDAQILDEFKQMRPVTVAATNRDPQKFTQVAVTGVTALVRAIAARMRTEGVLYPARDIGSILSGADITHVSNEVAFAEDCPTPDPNSASLKFCSNPDYLELLTSVGTDVVELSGNHVNDWGADNLAYTLGLYKQAGLKYYAGGANLEESRQPALFEDHGNKIAFIGCNPAGPKNAWATDTQAGSANCDDDWLPAEITQLKSDGWLPIVTLQFAESYNPAPLYPQQDMFRALADAGAVVVSGSQAHLPQGFGFEGDTLIHYGLGNLFFDQMFYDGLRQDLVGGTRWEFIDMHAFYDGRYLGVDLVTALLEDFAKPRLMTADERAALLQKMFAASDWNTSEETAP